MSKFENALAYQSGKQSSVTQEERLLAEYFPATTLSKWAKQAARQPADLSRLKVAAAPHRDYQLLLGLAAAHAARDKFAMRQARASLEPFLEVDGPRIHHPETGFRIGAAKDAAALPQVSAPAPVVPDTGDGPDTGPEAIAHALSKMTHESLAGEAHAILKAGGASKRGRAITMLNMAEGLKRNGMQPGDLVIRKVPVIPAQFRPTTVMGDQLTLGDANELYRDLIHTRDAYKELHGQLGDAGTGEDKLRLMDAVRATYGYGAPTNPKTKARGTTGFLSRITGKGGPKTGWVQSKLLAKPQDTVGRSVIVPDPDLSLDEISLPNELGWKMYGPHVQRRLVQSGMHPADALKHVLNRSPQAEMARRQVAGERPTIYSRAPAWHRFNVIAAYPKFHDGDHIAIPNATAAGLGADYDGDNQHSVLLCALKTAELDTWRRLIPDLALHETMFHKNTAIPAIQGHSLFVFDLEDFPHRAFTNQVAGEKGPIDFHDATGVKVLAYDERTHRLEWADVKSWSKHYAREVELVDLTNGYQIVTDDDPRAVYGVTAASLAPARFTPTAARANKVVVPRACRLPLEVTRQEFDTSSVVPPADDPRTLAIPAKLALTGELGWCVGAMAGDGWATPGYQFHLADADGWNAAALTARLNNIQQSAGCARLTEPGVRELGAHIPGRYGRTVKYTYSASQWAVLFKALVGGERDEDTSGSANKHLPVFFLQATEEFRHGLLAGIMDTDGSVAVVNAKGKKPQLMANLSSTSLRLAREVKLLAMSLGIKSRITPGKTPLGRDNWMLTFSNYDFSVWEGRRFMVNRTKLEKLQGFVVEKDTPAAVRHDMVPITKDLGAALRKLIGNPKITVDARKAGGEELAAKKARQTLWTALWQSEGRVSRFTAKAAVAHVGRAAVEALPEGAAWLDIVDNEDVTWEQVEAVQKTGIKEDGYDLTVPGYETFMSVDGVILSNTLNVHVPATHAAVKDATEKLLPSKMLHSVRDFTSIIPQPKHEQIWGLVTAGTRPAQNKHVFRSLEEAAKAVETGKIRMSDEVEIQPAP